MYNVWKIFSPGNKLKAEGVGQQTGKNDGSGDDLHEIEVFHEISVDDNYYDDYDDNNDYDCDDDNDYDYDYGCDFDYDYDYDYYDNDYGDD